MVDINKLAEQAAALEDQTVAQEGGGGSFEQPAAGVGGCRLVSYIELGEHETTYDGKTKKVEQVLLQFELVGKRWPSSNEETGREKPFIIGLTLTKSLNEKSNFFKLFQRLNYDGKAKHFAQLVGKEFKVTVILETKGEGAEKKTYANIRDASGYTLVPPFSDVDDGEGNIERKRVKFPEAVTPLKIFLWNQADKEQWDSLFIDGTYGDKKDKEGNVIEGSGTSKNWLQAKIKSAKNFKGSPMDNILGGSDALDIEEAEKPERKPEAKPAAKEVEEVDPLAEE